MNSCLGSPFCVLTFLPCREVVTFNHFLETAAEKEVQGKARLQDFIENLLHRVELAEKQLEYYHSQQGAGPCGDPRELAVSPAGPAWGLWCVRWGQGQKERVLGNDLQEFSRHHLKALPQPHLCCGSDTGEPRTPGSKWDPGCVVSSSSPPTPHQAEVVEILLCCSVTVWSIQRNHLSQSCVRWIGSY